MRIIKVAITMYGPNTHLHNSSQAKIHTVDEVEEEGEEAREVVEVRVDVEEPADAGGMVGVEIVDVCRIDVNVSSKFYCIGVRISRQRIVIFLV
jgi:hypothetical protein